MIWLLTFVWLIEGVFRGGVDHPAIGYTSRPERHAVADLTGRTADFRFEASGYLRSVLAALNLPEESQIVVFSKTSLMRHLPS